MPGDSIDAVTGAFGYTGKYIARKLLARGRSVITLTNSTSRQHEFGDRIQAYPLQFDRSEALARSLQNVDVLYNTYWVRFNYRLFTHTEAVHNTLILFEAAKSAGVKRIVHLSITNPSATSPFEYFRGKAQLEKALMNLGLSYAILRPALIFGKEDILINNIAWVLRHWPIFGLFGGGQYQIRPIYVEDLADLAISSGESHDSAIVNAVGPETFTYRELVAAIAAGIGVHRPLISVPPGLGYLFGRLMGLLTGDIVLTRPEIDALMAEILYVDSPASGTTRLTDWIKSNAELLGRHYSNELARRKDRASEYRSN